MQFPTISDYKAAVQVPESFRTLGHLRPEPGIHDEVFFSSGNFAVVFKMRDTRDGSLKALKCFTRDQARRNDSLEAVSEHLRGIQNGYLVPYTFLQDEVWVNDSDFPVLLMDWVAGDTLGERVKTLCEARDSAGLRRLAVAFAEMCLWLLEQDWAHSDLKHDNILVRPDGSLALVDYDGCFVPSMAGQPAREIGSPCYRHPKRTAAHFDRHIDDFSMVVIFLSLLALTHEPQRFAAHQNGENLLLSVGDLAEPARSPLLADLRQTADRSLQAAVALLEFMITSVSFRAFGIKGIIFDGFLPESKERLKPYDKAPSKEEVEALLNSFYSMLFDTAKRSSDDIKGVLNIINNWCRLKYVLPHPAFLSKELSELLSRPYVQRVSAEVTLIRREPYISNARIAGHENGSCIVYYWLCNLKVGGIQYGSIKISTEMLNVVFSNGGRVMVTQKIGSGTKNLNSKSWAIAVFEPEKR